MMCPVCQKEMVEENFGGVVVDTCKNGCKGIWFDWIELSKLDESNEGIGRALQDALKNSKVNDETRERINCPKCNIKMHIHKYKAAKEINVDECYVCAGFFLDSGELKEIRDNFMSEEEQSEYLNKLLEGNLLWQKSQKDIEKQELRAEALRKYTRFLRLSYYFTGK
ncbi:MAG: zf-TFIIB domain-containing protein [Candidatus Omnitrophica bacterium]|nr:zf-TFIIB domain-containing protein [Candidatus Omnitrophota bacterium]